jgi:hypothetical protein
MRMVSVKLGLVKVVGDQLARVVPPTLTGTVMLWVPNMAGVIPILIDQQERCDCFIGAIGDLS